MKKKPAIIMNTINWTGQGLRFCDDITSLFEQIPEIFEKVKKDGAKIGTIDILYTFAYCHIYFPYLIDANLATKIISYCRSVTKPFLQHYIIKRLVNHNMISRKNEIEWLRKKPLRSCKVDRKVDIQATQNRLIKQHYTIEYHVIRHGLDCKLLRMVIIRGDICDSIL